MAWMSEAEWELRQDCNDKKITARSARSTRTHCGKRGAVKLHSDFMTKKERDAMNGKCESYRLNSPMTWSEFKSMPEDLQKTYIKALRKTYNVPNTALAEMFGVTGPAVTQYFTKIGLGVGKAAGASKRVWNKEDFMAWRGIDICEEPANETVEETVTDELVAVNENAEINVVEPIEDDTCGDNTPDICTNPYHQIPVIPKEGSIRFDNNYADDILDTVRSLLANTKVNLSVIWSVVNYEGECGQHD